ncbi:conserved hypothetical protein [Candidatus Terasakiella magnetica]|nr:conserved hypothetical protein [Candidatus Terasakiella magnetica]
MSGWGCVHNNRGLCAKVANRPCDPGMKGCILAGRFRFSNPDKNRPKKPASEEKGAEPESPLPPPHPEE